MGRVLVAEIGRTANVGLSRPSTRIPRTLDWKFKTVAGIITAVLLLGIVSQYTVTEEIEPVDVTEGVTMYNATAAQRITNTWSVSTHQMFARNVMPGTDAGIVAQKYKGLYAESTFIQGTMLSFDYAMPFLPPSTFIDANLTIPMEWLAMTGDNGSKSLPFYVERSFTVSLYEVMGPWKYWYYNPTSTDLNQSSNQKDGVTWAMVRDGKLNVSRIPLDVLTGINYTTNGYGFSTHGSLTFNISRAIEDWNSGTWFPKWGFLVTILAPWETTDYEWFELGSLDYVGVVIQAGRAQMQIGVDVPIPEFELLVVTTIFIAMTAIIYRRGRGEKE